jgi:5-methylthioadenosine/S-adenosylhomocysteine deaminase
MDAFKIVANARIITCDPDNRAGRYNLLIRDDRIVEISDQTDLFTSLHPSAVVVDASNKLIVPGFVNAHFHSESVLLRARTDGLHCSLWKSDLRTQECIKGLLDPASNADVRATYLMSYFSHLKSGTTCVGEFGLPFGEETFGLVLQAMERTEVKNVIALQNWDQFVKASDVPRSKHQFLVSIGRAEDFTVYSFENLVRAAKELKVPLIAHIGEQRTETDLVKKNFQKSLIPLLQDYNIVSPENVFVHLNHLAAQETQALAEAGASAVLCVRSAAFKRTGYPALRNLATQRIRLAIGTDWGNVDMLEEMKFMSQLHLLISGIPPFSLLQLLRMATINGAHALGLSNETGSIEAGKKADLAFFSLEDLRLPVIPEFADAETLASLLVNHLSSRDISDVMIDGEFYVARGQVMTMAEEEILESFRSAYAKYYNGETRKTPMPGSVGGESSRQAARILSFAPSGRTSQPEEGFESGFEADEKSSSVLEMKSSNINLQPPASPPSKETPPQQQPPQKKSWLTFGEDENF